MPAQPNGALHSDDTRRRYEDLVASLDGIVWESDARTFQFTFVSHQAERLLGYSAERWLEPGFWIEHLHPDDRDWAYKFCLEATRSKRNHTFEYRMITAIGRTIWLRDLVTVLVEDGEPKTLRGVMVDITEAKQAEMALRETVERLRLAAQAGKIGLWDWDLKTNSVVFSREWKSQLGYGEAEIPDAYVEWETRLHPDDVAPTTAALEACLQGRHQEYAVEFRMRHKDGSWRWIYARGETMRDAAGAPVRMLGCHVDITERKQAEEERPLHLWFLESMDRVNRAIQSTSNVDHMLSNVLDAVLSVFDCDRAFLAFPCDPEATSWTAHAEATRPEFPSIGTLGADVPMRPGVAEASRIVLSSNGPVPFGAGCEHQIPAELRGPLRLKALLVMAVYPKVGAPWVFGLHQCRDVRIWSRAEHRLFQEIGRRIADALSSLLVVRRLEESEQRLREAERLAHVGYWHQDFERDLVTWSDETYRIWGLPENSPLELGSLPRLIHPEDRARVDASVRSTIEGGPRHDLEFRAVRPDGDVRVLHSQGDLVRDTSGRPLRFFGTVQDITERRRAEQGMIESHNLLNSVIEGTTDAVYVKDLEGRYVLINSAGMRATGRPAVDIIGRMGRDVFPPSMAETIEQTDRELIASGGSKTYELTDTTGGQSKAWLVSSSIFRDATGRPIGLVGLARDITELKRLEEQLRQAQKMEAVGRLAGGVAHDFNNILTVINGFSRLMFDRMPESDENREPLAEIMQAGERAASLTRQLLAFSRKQLLRPQIVNVNPLLGGLCNLLRALIGEDIALAFRPLEDLRSAALDPGQFEQAIINLAVNARDAMPQGGRLVIETSEREIDELYAQANPDVRPGWYVCVAVSDSGIGMDKATKARIFEPFFTTKELGKGTGLGLAMLYGFVKQSGGHIDVSSAPGAGTTFSIYLPVEARAESTEIEKGAPVVPRGTETVLLVEDETAVRSLIRAVLESNGYTVLEAGDGEGGIARAASHDGHIDLVVTDMVMPRLGGRELAETLRRTRPDVRVLFMSGYTDQPFDQESSNRFDAFLQKPFSPQELARKLREVLDTPA